MSSIIVTVSGKEFNVNYDIKEMLQEINECTCEGGFCHLNDSTASTTKEELDEEIENAKCLVRNLDEDNTFLIPMINRMSKKKNGYLKKGSIAHIWYDNVSYLSDEEYGYRTLSIKAKAIDEKTINLFITMDIQPW